MKTFHWSLYVFLFLFIFTACKKEDKTSLAPTSKEDASLVYKSSDQIPNEIIPLLYQDLVKDKLYAQAENLKASYYNTLALRTDDHRDLLKTVETNLSSAKIPAIAAANLPTRPVPGIGGGVVLNGNWVTTSGTTSANVQALGIVSIDFNAMNGNPATGGAPDVANPSPAPAVGQFLGTTGQSKRLEAFSLPFIQFAAADNLGTTYYTGSFPFTYQAHVEGIGWQSYVSSSSFAGTIGQSRRIEAIKIYGPGLNNPNYTLTFNDSSPSTTAKLYIYYRVHADGLGWMNWVPENNMAGTTGQSRRLEAMQVRAYLVKI